MMLGRTTYNTDNVSYYQFNNGTIQTNDNTKGFVEEVALIWHVKKTIVFRIRFSPDQYRVVF